jgi:hypothetical protein
MRYGVLRSTERSYFPAGKRASYTTGVPVVGGEGMLDGNGHSSLDIPSIEEADIA